jgi:NAD(P)H-dependent FMN reductase
MVATTTTTEKGLSIKVADSDFTLVDILADIDMRTGTPVDETGWLDGNAGGSYPGSLTGFTAQNTDGNALGSLRMVTFTANIVQATTVEPLLFSAGASKILGIVGIVSATSAKDVTATMTNTGLAGADETVAPLATTGDLPCLILESESANQVVQVTVLLLN